MKTVYHDANGNTVINIDMAETSTVSTGFIEKGKFTGFMVTFDMDSTLLTYDQYSNGFKNGHHFEHNPESLISLRGKYLEGTKAGNWFKFNSHGDIVGLMVYGKNGQLIVENDLSESAEVIYKSSDLPAEFSGGRPAWNSYLKKNLRFPRAASKAKAQGDVVVEFYVMKDGSVLDVVVLESPHEALSAHAISLVQKSGNWVPAMKNNKAVNGIVELKIKFVNRLFKGIKNDTWKAPRIPVSG